MFLFNLIPWPWLTGYSGADICCTPINSWGASSIFLHKRMLLWSELLKLLVNSYSYVLMQNRKCNDIYSAWAFTEYRKHRVQIFHLRVQHFLANTIFFPISLEDIASIAFKIGENRFYSFEGEVYQPQGSLEMYCVTCFTFK